MYNTIEDLKVLCGKSPDDFGMDDSTLLSDGKTQWTLFLESASEFALMKVRAWGFENADISKLKQAEVYLVKAYLSREFYSQSINDVASISLVGVQSVTMRKTSMEELNSIIKGFVDAAYNLLQVTVVSDVGRDYVLVV